MVTLETARELRAAGLVWEPAVGDRFVVPDRGMDDRVFTLSDMVVESKTSPAGAYLAFNGTVEWALDAIMQREVVWIPREAQLRDALGDTFVRLDRVGDAYRVVTTVTGEAGAVLGATPDEAYAAALLEHLRSGVAAP